MFHVRCVVAVVSWQIYLCLKNMRQAQGNVFISHDKILYFNFDSKITLNYELKYTGVELKDLIHIYCSRFLRDIVIVVFNLFY